MKTKMIFLLSGFLAFNVSAQNLTLDKTSENQTPTGMELTKVEYHQKDLSLTAVSLQPKFRMTSKKLEEYLENPKHFFYRQFDFSKLVEKYAESEYEDFQVSMKFDKGAIYAKFSKDGDLIETHYNFSDLRVPLEIGRKICDTYNGWSIVKTEVHHSSKGENTSAIYDVWIENGDQKKRLKFKNTGDPVVRYAEVYNNDDSWES